MVWVGVGMGADGCCEVEALVESVRARVSMGFVRGWGVRAVTAWS